jgi:hypothetical protein
MCSAQMATSGFVNHFWQNGLPIALSIATYIIFRGLSIFGVTDQRTNLEIMSLLTTNIPGGIRIDVQRSAMPRHRQPIPNTLRAMFTENSTFDVMFPDL